MFEIRKVTTPSKPLGASLATSSMRDGCHGLVALPPRGGEGKSLLPAQQGRLTASMRGGRVGKG
jgi:hypothetical protein